VTEVLHPPDRVLLSEFQINPEPHLNQHWARILILQDVVFGSRIQDLKWTSGPAKVTGGLWVD
jgi:hypothetical protein